MIVPNELEMLDNEMSVWTVATGVVDPFKRASRKAVEFIQKQDGFVGVHPAENGTLWLFKTKEDAIKARRKMGDKGIHTGDNIVEVYIEKKYVK